MRKYKYVIIFKLSGCDKPLSHTVIAENKKAAIAQLDYYGKIQVVSCTRVNMTNRTAYYNKSYSMAFVDVDI